MKLSLFRIAAMPVHHHRRSRDARQLRILPADGDLHMGIGLTTREDALRLALPPQSIRQNSANGGREIILAPVRERRREPGEACERIGRWRDGSCLDLFAPAANENRVVVASEDGDAA